MLRLALLAGGSWLGSTPLAMLLGQSVAGDGPTPLTSLVFGALGSSPAPLILAWVVTRGDKEKAELRADNVKLNDEIRRLNDLRTDAAKEMATLLERAATTFADVKAGMDVTLTKARPDDISQTLRDLKTLLEEYPRRESRGP